MTEALEKLLQLEENRINLYNYPDFYDLVYQKEYPHDKLAEEILNRVDRNSSILSVGCGTGILLGKLDNLEVTGIDTSQRMIERASERTEGELVTEDITELRLNKKFDIVEATGQTLNHVKSFKQLKSALKNIRQMMKPESFLIFDFYVDINDRHSFDARYIEIGDYNIKLQEEFEQLNKEQFIMKISYEIEKGEARKVLRTQVPMFIPSKNRMEQAIHESGFDYSTMEDFFNIEQLVMLESEPK